MAIDWDALYKQYLVEKTKDDINNWLRVLAAVRKSINTTPKDQALWVIKALEEDQRKWMVAHAFSVTDNKEAYPFPDYLVQPAIRAGVYERDPSFNKHFILPCMTAVGYRTVNEALLHYVENGTNDEIAGAINALYWASFQWKYRPEVKKWFRNPETKEPYWEKLEPACLAEYEATQDIRATSQHIFLKTFVANNDLHVRRSLISRLTFNPEKYPAELQPLVMEAMSIAVNHPDKYIQNRVQLKLGNTQAIKPLPHRS